EFRLPASGDEDVGALGDEPPGRGQADAAVAPGNDRDLTFQFLRHGTPPLPLRAVRVKGWKLTACLVGPARRLTPAVPSRPSAGRSSAAPPRPVRERCERPA